jgi:uncharacterized membrane protein YbhN (UPF0104 family)
VNISSVQQRLDGLGEVARRIAARRDVRILSRAGALLVVAVVVLNSRSLFSQLGAVGHPDMPWLLGAVAAEIASLLAYVLIAREFLRLGRVAAPVADLLRPTLAGIAMSASLPAGAGASNVYWYKQLRRLGADRGLAALVMTGTSVAGTLSLIGLVLAGVALAGGTGPLAGAHTWLPAVGAVALTLRRAFARRLGRRLGNTVRRVAPTVEPEPGIRARRLRTIMMLAYGNWLLDCVTLYLSLGALHAAVPCRSVILVYALAQLVASIAVLPGGGGTVELTLATGFAAFGHHSGTVLAGVLLYRLLACWGLIPIGWLAFGLDPDRTPQPVNWRRRCRPGPVTRRRRHALRTELAEDAA